MDLYNIVIVSFNKSEDFQYPQTSVSSSSSSSSFLKIGDGLSYKDL